MSRKRVLFLCTGNSCRSQMAEGLVNYLLGDRWEARSAGTAPVGYVHPLAVEAMAELGVNIAGARSKSVDELRDLVFDVVITVCDHANEVCPVFPYHATKFHHNFSDPSKLPGTDEEVLPAYRATREEIKNYVRELTEAEFISSAKI